LGRSNNINFQFFLLIHVTKLWECGRGWVQKTVFQIIVFALLCVSLLYAFFTMHFFLIQSFFVQVFSSNSYGCLLSPRQFFLPLKSGSKVKNSELSRLPKIKKISLSMVRIFHISTKSTFLFRMKSAWSHLQLYPVGFLKFWHFTLLLERFAWAISNGTIFGQMSFKG
jgi:hypothetical protein